MTDKEKLRIYVDAALPYATSIEHLAKVLYEKYEVTIRITNKGISFKLASAKQAIRGKCLGDDYYNGLWDKYNEQHVNLEIQTRGR
ncbi:MAG: hypothetical protein ACERKN_10595 [Velocimicrobium sp.]